MSDARTVLPGHAVTYHHVDPVQRHDRLADTLAALAAAISIKASERMAAAATTVPGPQAYQLRGAGLALQDFAAVLREMVEKL